MPTIDTKYFGAMSYEEESCFDFPCGLPAFDNERQFLPLHVPEQEPLVFLQSTKTPELCFVAIPVLVADPAYCLAATREDLEIVGLGTARQPCIGSEALVLALLAIRDQAPATANLLAPLVINLANRRAVQAIRCDSRYSHQHPLSICAEKSAC